MNKYDKRKKEKIYITKNLCVLLSLVLRLHVCPDLEKKMGKTNKTKVKYYTPIEQSSGYVARHSLHTHTHTTYIYTYIYSYIDILTR
jgi:hypothetical protein